MQLKVDGELVTIDGVGPDAPILTNASGGKQSASPYRADLLPPRACLAIARVLKQGVEKLGHDTWRAVPLRDHLNHALIHLFAFLAGDTQDDHLEHAACRLLMSLEAPRE